MRNKRGLLLAESTLKIIVAILCIVLLVYLLFSLYSSFKANEALEQAKSSISRIEVALDEAEEKGQSEVVILGPAITTKLSFEKIWGSLYGKAWWIVVFPAEKRIIVGKVMPPKTCENNGWENCLCICSSNVEGLASRTVGECDRLGVCIEAKHKITTEYVGYGIDQQRQWWHSGITPLPILLSEAPINLKIKYENNQFKVTR